jgi:hypothetical protein
MQQEVDDFVAMNTSGMVLELCEKYYDNDVLMLNNGAVFAKSMRESYDKQKGFVSSVKKFEVKLLSSEITKNIAELTFRYKMTGPDSTINEFTRKHIQTWKNGKIVHEEYLSIEPTYQVAQLKH